MTRFLLCLLLVLSLAFPRISWAQPASAKLTTREIALDGRVVVVDSLHSEVQIEATAFELPNGRRRDIAPPKIKVLKVSGETGLYDNKEKIASALSDLKIGVFVRVVGQDGGSGRPLVTRLILWNLPERSVPEKGGEGAQATSTPAPASLLPTPELWKDIDISVTKAGFGPAPQGAGLIDPKWKLTVRSRQMRQIEFVELQTPEYPIKFPPKSDQTLPDGSVERTFEFASNMIDPRWPSVRARFRMNAKDSPVGAQGSIVTFLPAEIPIPAQPNGVLEPHLVWKAPGGINVELVRVEAHDADNHLKLEWKWTPPTNNPNVRGYLDLENLRSGDKDLGYVRDELFGRNDGKSRTIVENLAILPRGAPLKGYIYLRVYDASLRKKEFQHIVNFDLPVAKLAAENPLEYRMPQIEPVDYEKDNVNFRWEGTPNGEGTLWVSPQDTDENAKNHTRLLLRNVHLTAPGESEVVNEFDGRFYESRGNSFWHSDGTPAGPLETGWRIDRPNYQRNPKVTLKATVMPAQVFESEHHFADIPLPREGETKQLPDGQWADDTVSVRKIAWVPFGTPQYKELEKVTGGMGDRGTMVVVCELTRVWPQKSMYWLGDLSFNVDGFFIGSDISSVNKVNSTSHDALPGDHPIDGAISFFVFPPAESEQTLDMSFHVNEVVLSPTKTYTLDNIPFP